MNINDIKRQTDTYGNGLMCAGMGLETLSNILGADGCEQLRYQRHYRTTPRRPRARAICETSRLRYVFNR
jgi:hypothetical protein